MREALEKIAASAKEQLAKVADIKELEELRIKVPRKKRRADCDFKADGRTFSRRKTGYRTACK